MRGKSCTGDVGISRFGPRGRAHCWRSTLHLSFRPFIFLLWPFVPSSLFIFHAQIGHLVTVSSCHVLLSAPLCAVNVTYGKFSKLVVGWLFFCFSKRGPPFVFPPLCHCSSVNVPLISVFQGHVSPFSLNCLFPIFFGKTAQIYEIKKKIILKYFIVLNIVLKI